MVAPGVLRWVCRGRGRWCGAWCPPPGGGCEHAGGGLAAHGAPVVVGGGYSGGVAGGAGYGVHVRGVVVSMRRGLRCSWCAPWWWPVGMLAPAWFPLHVSGGLRSAHGAPEVVAGCTCAGIVRECRRRARCSWRGPWWWAVMTSGGVAGLTCAGIGAPAGGGGGACVGAVALLTSGACAAVCLRGMAAACPSRMTCRRRGRWCGVWCPRPGRGGKHAAGLHILRGLLAGAHVPEVVAGCTCAGMVRECRRLACPVLMAGPWW